MIRRASGVLDRAVRLVDARLGAAEDERARSRGWSIARSGRHGLGRCYRDPRWAVVGTARLPVASENVADQA
ncbi:hypothetical protein [Amycolatopsis thailandensis]|uniref:hypothetical protein n=1 Tax=Amycolatopsis thailandensis TaxID=589330 RepID=UPI0036405D20